MTVSLCQLPGANLPEISADQQSLPLKEPEPDHCCMTTFSSLAFCSYEKIPRNKGLPQLAGDFLEHLMEGLPTLQFDDI